MRYLLPLLFVFVINCHGPKSARGDDASVIARYEAAVQQFSETVGNQTAELEAVKEELKGVKKGLEEVRKLLSADAEPAAPVLQIRVPEPPAEPAKADAPAKDDDRRNGMKMDAARGVTFQGRRINLSEWLHRPVKTVEINGDVIAHLKDHGLDGDFEGLSRSSLIQLHSVAHTYNVPLKSAAPRRVVVKAPTVVLPQASNCANGNCARNWSFSWRRR